MTETVFAKIISGELKADIVYEDDLCLAFKDVNPVAPTHILLIPKKEIAKLSDLDPEVDAELMGHLLVSVKKITNMLGIADSYRVIINNGAGAGQTVYHLHLHIISGRPMNWPPG